MNRFKINILTVAAVVAGGLFVIAPAAFAQTTASSSNILQDVQAAVQSLVSAKDTGNTNDVALRVTAFEQVLSLSESEAQSYELKLVNTQSGKAYASWKSNTLSALSQALEYYSSEEQLLNGTSTITSAGIKQIATDFAKWRENTYLPLVGAIQDFLLVNQESGAVQTAQTRYGKIVNDLQSLGSAVTGSQEISSDLKDASSSIAAAADFSRQATNLFLSIYVNATSTAAASSTASSSLSLEITPLDLTATSSESDTPTSTATSSPDEGTSSSTALSGQATSTMATSSNPISIKGLVTASLDKVRNAYQDFIDISNLVRSLLD